MWEIRGTRGEYWNIRHGGNIWYFTQNILKKSPPLTLQPGYCIFLSSGHVTPYPTPYTPSASHPTVPIWHTRTSTRLSHQHSTLLNLEHFHNLRTTFLTLQWRSTQTAYKALAYFDKKWRQNSWQKDFKQLKELRVLNTGTQTFELST